MPKPAGRRATYEDVLAAPFPLVAEIIDGELVTSPRPALQHARATSILGIDIGGPFERGRAGPGGWWILDEPELHLADDILVPDLAGWRRERMPTPPSDPYATVAPDWVSEVLSAGAARNDRVRKLRLYARAGVSHAWLVDPQARTLEVFRASGEQWLMVSAHAGDDRVRAEPFDAVELELGALWIPDATPG